jgi:hypothetical protein
MLPNLLNDNELFLIDSLSLCNPVMGDAKADFRPSCSWKEPGPGCHPRSQLPSATSAGGSDAPAKKFSFSLPENFPGLHKTTWL